MKKKVIVYELRDERGHQGMRLQPRTVNTLLWGTLEDIRTYVKNLWKLRFFQDNYSNGWVEEEEFYADMDIDKKLTLFIEELGWETRALCEVPIEDFMVENLEISK